jgi:hypothetical protein
MKTDTIIYHEPKYKSENNNLQLLRVTIDSEHSKFDFGYQASDYYAKGGTITIGKDTFIRLNKSKIKHHLIKADNIPVRPNKFHFKTTKDWLYFSLYFPTISTKNGILDLIENETGKSDYFNFHGIELK